MNKIGYICRIAGKGTGYMFRFIEASYTRKISSRSDRVYSKILYPQNYDDVKFNTEIMRTKGIILVCEPFFLDDELREKAIKWVEWANNADPSEYDPFCESGRGG